MIDISSLSNTRVVLKSRPVGMPTDDNFDIQTVPVTPPGEDEMLLRTLWLSLDPYMRGRMSDRKSYAKPLDIGDVITGGVVCQVVASNINDYPVGTIVSGMYGWQSYAIGAGLLGAAHLTPYVYFQSGAVFPYAPTVSTAWPGGRGSSSLLRMPPPETSSATPSLSMGTLP